MFSYFHCILGTGSCWGVVAGERVSPALQSSQNCLCDFGAGKEKQIRTEDKCVSGTIV